MVEHMAPMMPAPFAVRAANDLMINKAVHFMQASINTKKQKEDYMKIRTIRTVTTEIRLGDKR